MSSSDYEEILASVQDVVHRAYSLGRAEALKRVIEVMKSDDPPAKPLALSGPAPAEAAPASLSHSPPPAAEPAPAPEPASGSPDQPAPPSDVAWWARPARTVTLQSRRAGRG